MCREFGYHTDSSQVDTNPKHIYTHICEFVLGYAHPVAKCFASIALMSPMYTHTPNGVCVHDETGSAGCEFPHKIHTQQG